MSNAIWRPVCERTGVGEPFPRVRVAPYTWAIILRIPMSARATCVDAGHIRKRPLGKQSRNGIVLPCGEHLCRFESFLEIQGKRRGGA